VNTHFLLDLEMSSQGTDTVGQGKVEKGADDSYGQNLSTGAGIMKIGLLDPEI
jgi:hypothetical protein